MSATQSDGLTQPGGFPTWPIPEPTPLVLVNGDYVEYVAILNQSGTSDPTVTVLYNGLGAELVWTRAAAGNYLGTLTNAFPTATKVAAWINLGGAVLSGYHAMIRRNTASALLIATLLQATLVNTDGILINSTVIVRIYP